MATLHFFLSVAPDCATTFEGSNYLRAASIIKEIGYLSLHATLSTKEVVRLCIKTHFTVRPPSSCLSEVTLDIIT